MTLSSVGTVYEIALNDVGYMLADSPNAPVGRTTSVLQDPRLVAPGDASAGVDRYTFLSQTDWSGGAGQKTLERDGSSPGRFWRSFGVDPFTEPGRLVPLNKLTTWTTGGTTPEGGPGARTATDVWFIASGTEICAYSAATTKYTSVGLGAAGVISLTSDGRFLYASDKSTIYKIDTAAAIPATWPTLVTFDSDLLVHAGQRLCVATYTSVAAKTARLPNRFTTLSDSTGAEEVVGGRITFPEGNTIVAIVDGGSHIYFGVNGGHRSWVYSWQVGSSDTPEVAWTNDGGLIRGLGFNQGNLVVAVSNPTETQLWRFAALGGQLEGEMVFSTTTLSWSTGRVPIVGYGRFVYFPWTEATGQRAIGVLDLSTGGYAQSYATTDSTGGRHVHTIGFEPDTGKLLVGVGTTFQEKTTNTWENGWVESSETSLGQVLRKRLLGLVVSLDPAVAATGSMTAELEGWADGVESTTTISSGTWKESNVTPVTFSRVYSRINLTYPTTSTPIKVAGVSLKIQPTTATDVLVELPVQLQDEEAGLNGALTPTSGVGTAGARLRALEALVGSVVPFQDVDWPASLAVSQVEVVRVEAESFSTGGSRGYVAKLTLRRTA